MNKRYLEDDNFKKAYKDFVRLCEWSFVPNGLDEDEGEDVEGQNEPMPQYDGMNQMPPQGNGEGEMPAADGNMPPMDGMNQAPQDENMPQDPNQMAEPMPNDSMIGQDIPQMDGDNGSEEDEEVIDVDKLTDAQEKLNKKTNAVGRNLISTDNKIEKLVQLISKASEMIDANNKSIEDLKRELEMRSPTNQEKMNLRSLSSTPFTVDPRKFWTDKASENNHYAPYSDNDEGTEYGKRGKEEYTISSDDIKNINDREIADTFTVPDELKMDLHKILGF